MELIDYKEYIERNNFVSKDKNIMPIELSRPTWTG
jgi:hypothetical protein